MSYSRSIAGLFLALAVMMMMAVVTVMHDRLVMAAVVARQDTLGRGVTGGHRRSGSGFSGIDGREGSEADGNEEGADEFVHWLG